jgi:hypothetical protein
MKNRKIAKWLLTGQKQETLRIFNSFTWNEINRSSRIGT